MSILETCGGYEKAKIYVAEFKKMNLSDAAGLFETELLEYRRANGIFEEGDTVVAADLRFNPKLWEWKGSTNWRPNHSLLWCDDGVLHPFSNDAFRHATDEEIKFGCRVDQINAKILEKFGGRENVATIIENAEGVRNVSTLGMTVTVERLRVAYES